MLTGGRRGRSGVVALEVAIVMPVLIIITLASFDLVNAVSAWRSVRAAATATAEIATSIAVQTGLNSPCTIVANGNTTTPQNCLVGPDVQRAGSTIFAYLQNLRGAGNTVPFSVALTSVIFKPLANTKGCSNGSCVCLSTASTTSGNSTTIVSTPAINGTTNTTGTVNGGTTTTTQCYTADIVWSTSDTYGTAQSMKRTCGTKVPTSTPPLLPSTSTATSLTTLPPGVYGPFSLMVVDISYTFTPMFLHYVMGSITFLESAYVPPRIGSPSSYIFYSPYNDGSVCPEFQYPDEQSGS